MFCLLLLAAVLPAVEPSPLQPVGALPDGRWITPTQQILSPVGRQVDLPGMRPQDLALSPDGKLLAVGVGSDALQLVDPKTGRMLASVKLPKDAAGSEGRTGAADATNLNPNARDKISLAGLVFSPRGDRLYFSNVNGSIKVFSVSGVDVRPLGAFALPPADAPRRPAEIPAGLAVSGDGRRLYVAGDLSNRLLELDAESGRLLRAWDVGVAPFAVVLTGGRAYVSNQGGPRVNLKSPSVGPGGQGTLVSVNAESIADRGSVTIVDLEAGRVKAEIAVGSHAAALAVTPSGRYVVVASAGADLLQVIDTRRDELVERISARLNPGDPFGAQPSALAFDRQGDTLYVANATQNAIAVVRFDPADNSSRVIGLVPVGWFPSSLAYDRRRDRLDCGNMKGIGAARRFAPGEPVKLHTRDFWGTLSLVPAPVGADLTSLTQTALFDLRYGRLLASRLPPRADQPARPVPERAGEPSVFHHVIYVIKENRTYDQILGDMKEGNGDATLCTFGENYTPNEHALARKFVLLDNTYCSGVDSADGHQWTDEAIANDYLERQMTSATPRSYPSAKNPNAADALDYASSGFLWDNAVRHGHTFVNYGEWLMTDAGWAEPGHKGKPGWLDYWHEYRERGGTVRLASHPAIESMRAQSDLTTVGWDLDVPDVLRARHFIEQMRAAEASGKWPDFMLLYLPNDHTAGTKPGMPQPGSEVADNDLALGQVVDALSHSRFWKDTCLLAIEDDPQSGWDHVSGYRTTCYVASAYTRRGERVRTQYNQLSLIRTMELILGIPPLNQMDATAGSMSDCFTETPDFTPFVAVPNQVPLDDMVPPAKRIKSKGAKKRAAQSARLPLRAPDQCDDDELNRILWGAMKTGIPYPVWAVKSADNDG